VATGEGGREKGREASVVAGRSEAEVSGGMARAAGDAAAWARHALSTKPRALTIAQRGEVARSGASLSAFDSIDSVAKTMREQTRRAQFVKYKAFSYAMLLLVKKRRLGKTGLLVSELALGTWGLSGEAYGMVSPEDAERTILRALEIGLTTIDTSDAYGAGKVEATLGRILEGRDGLTVITRGGVDRRTEPPTQNFTPEFIEAAVTRSQKRLRRETLDIYLLHNPSTECLRRGEATAAIQSLVKRGRIARWGVAVGNVDVARAALDQGAEVLEIAYNLFHASDLHHIAGDVMVAGAGIVARSTLGYGLLAGLWTKDRDFPIGDHRRERWTKPELAHRVGQLDAIRFLLKGEIRSMRAAAVRFALANHLVSAVVLGPRSVPQLEQLVREVGSGPTYIPESDLAALPHALSQVGIST
jgi:aryl-alcohol dehydrogenase-like predicted oxidoreductase